MILNKINFRFLLTIRTIFIFQVFKGSNKKAYAKH